MATCNYNIHTMTTHKSFDWTSVVIYNFVASIPLSCTWMSKVETNFPLYIIKITRTEVTPPRNCSLTRCPKLELMWIFSTITLL